MPAANEMQNKRRHGEDEKKVNQPARKMKTVQPQNQATIRSMNEIM